ncbi:MAG: DUF996 domain-containing protein [Thermodesulfobacterium sp.]|nr:DUF996 domain-containing protein [Thermodesulfobacterium sp.]
MNGNVSTPKLIGGIGAILLILTITPHFGAIAGLAGIVLIFISLNMFSKIFNDPQIFKNALISFIITIIGGFLAIFTVGAIFFSLFTMVRSHPHSSHIFSHIGIGTALVLTVLYILLIVSAHYLKTSFYLLSSYTGVNLYKTGGLLYFIGTILMIVVLGVLVNLVAWVLIAVAFFTTPEEIKSEA